MLNPTGESDLPPLRPIFDRRPKLEFHGSRVTSDAGLLAYRELDDTLGQTAMSDDVLADSRTGKNGWHGVVGLLRQSIYGRLAGYEDVNDADRLGHDPAMRWIVGGKAVERGDAAFASPGIYDYLEAGGVSYAIRLPANTVLQQSIAHLLKRPVGRPPKAVRHYHASFGYRAASWSRTRRVVAKVEWHPGELYPRVGYIVTNLSRPAERVVTAIDEGSRL